jgi:hypothetical protein
MRCTQCGSEQFKCNTCLHFVDTAPFQDRLAQLEVALRYYADWGGAGADVARKALGLTSEPTS